MTWMSSSRLVRAAGSIVVAALAGCGPGEAGPPAQLAAPIEVELVLPELPPQLASELVRLPAARRLPFALDRFDPERAELERVDPVEDDERVSVLR